LHRKGLNRHRSIHGVAAVFDEGDPWPTAGSHNKPVFTRRSRCPFIGCIGLREDTGGAQPPRVNALLQMKQKGHFWKSARNTLPS